MAFEIYSISKNVYQSNREEAIALASKSNIGEIKNGKVIYSILEVLYLLDKNKAELIEKNKALKFNEFMKQNKKLHTIYEVFKDLRDKGHVIKEGMKFGADFRVYEKGDKPGKNHAKYLLHILPSSKKLSPKDFAAKARVAHSTNKILLMALVDSEGDVSYYEINWKSY